MCYLHQCVSIYSKARCEQLRPNGGHIDLRYCEGYTDNRIRTDGEYIHNEANRQHTCIYIVWLYELEPRT